MYIVNLFWYKLLSNSLHIYYIYRQSFCTTKFKLVLACLDSYKMD